MGKLVAHHGPRGGLLPPVTPIAAIYDEPQNFAGQQVTLQAQVYIPTNYVEGKYSGFVQDASGRGLNVCGDGANNAAFFEPGNLVEVTGTVEVHSSNLEITNVHDVQLLSADSPPLLPVILQTGVAASSSTMRRTHCRCSSDLCRAST